MKIQCHNFLKSSLGTFLFIISSNLLSAQSDTNKPAILSNEKTSIGKNVLQKNENIIPVVTDRIYNDEELKTIQEKKSLPDISKGIYKYEVKKDTEIREVEKIEIKETDKIPTPK